MKDYITNEYSVITKLSTVNYLLSERCNKLNNLLWQIRDYLVECKEDKTKVDIEMLISWLD